MITEEYRKLNADMHVKNKNYGNSGHKKAKLIIRTMKHFDAMTVLDYGAGKQTLKPYLIPLAEYQAYDPAIPGIDKMPRSADLVICTDVMEHVEPEFIDAVLEHIFSLTHIVAVFSICCEVGGRILANGQPAHCSVHPAEWWIKKLSVFGTVEQKENITEDEEIVCVVWKEARDG